MVVASEQMASLGRYDPRLALPASLSKRARNRLRGKRKEAHAEIAKTIRKVFYRMIQAENVPMGRLGTIGALNQAQIERAAAGLATEFMLQARRWSLDAIPLVEGEALINFIAQRIDMRL